MTDLTDARKITAHEAADLISTSAVKGVRFGFYTIGAVETGWLRVPKAEAERMLRSMKVESFVRYYEPEEDCIAYICGAFPAAEGAP